jgi:Flp pilus assembly protein TadG
MMKRLSPSRFWARLARARDGAAAVEFALIVPVMVLLFMGTFEITGLLMADLKLTAACETAADLVAQTTYNPATQSATLVATDLTSFTTASQLIMTPLPTSGSQLKIAYASVTFTTGAPVIDWHVENNGATPITLATIPNNTGNAAVTALVVNNATDSIIVVHAQYSYSSPSTYFLNSTPYTLNEWSFNRPRYATCIASYANATPGVCP